jgi:protein-tyrosine phosphatase
VKAAILFVCMGNICRSPVVEAIARAEFARAGLDVEVASAGTESYHIGHCADARSIASARAHGYDVAPHRARQVGAAMLARYDAVLAMDRVNLRDLAQHCPPGLMSRAGLFLPFAGIDAPQEVPDPYYGDASDFERVIELAKAGVRGLITRGTLAHNAGMPTRLSSST